MKKIELLKITDRLIGTPLAFLLPPLKVWNGGVPHELKNVLLIRPGGIGDAVLLLPAISALATGRPGINIDILCEKRNHEVFSFTDRINRVFLYDRGMDLLGCLRAGYDAVVDTEQWYRLSALAARMAGARLRIGFDTNIRRKMFTHRIPYDQEEHEVYNFLRLVRPLLEERPDFDPERPFMNVPEGMPSHLIPPETGENGKMLAVFPGASLREKEWELEKFIEVAGELAGRGYTVVLLGAKSDRGKTSRIKEKENRCIDLAGRTSLQQVAQILRSSRVLITSDSGLMHMAFAIGTPTVSLFGSGNPRKWAPIGKKHTVIRKDLPCSPCSRFGTIPPCPRDTRCLRSITPSDVLLALDKVL